MEKYNMLELGEKVKLYGRCFRDEQAGILYADWTCGGFEVRFKGTRLLVSLVAFPDTHMEMIPGDIPGSQEMLTYPEWPHLAVVLDGGEKPYKRIGLTGNRDTVCLFESEEEELHTIRVVKLTENFRTQVGYQTLFAEGSLESPAAEGNLKRIEFIGDSITCGFGNGTHDGSRPFFTAEENGWMTHGAIAARLMGWEASFICVSGISVHRQSEIIPVAMDEIYSYTDKPLEEKLGRREEENFAVWGFEEHPVDYIVLNLGTNDAAGILLSGNREKAEEEFSVNYRRFLETLRERNGVNTVIICALGSIDYYIYDNIQRIVSTYAEETGDDRIFCMKYTKMLFGGKDVGACFHPSEEMQGKMAAELTEVLKKCEAAMFTGKEAAE